jgi:hypothetical protein
MFEGTMVRILEGDHQRQDLAGTQTAHTMAMPARCGQEMLLPGRRKGLVEVIETAK